MARTPLALWLDELADAVVTGEDRADDPGARRWLAGVVRDLEHRADAALGGTDGDPVVVLWRRLDRARCLLLADERAAPVDAAVPVA